MWKNYRHLIQKYPRISLSEERRLILQAQKGSKKSKDELLLRHIGFLIFRIQKVAFPGFIIDYLKKEMKEPILSKDSEPRGRNYFLDSWINPWQNIYK